MSQSFLFSAALSLMALAMAPSIASAEHPCRSIVKQCRSQGYSTGGPRSSGQGLVKDCLEKIVAGQTLTGVSAPFDTVSSCKSRWKARGSATRVATKNRKLNQKVVSSAKTAKRQSTGLIERSTTSSSGPNGSALQ